VGTVRRIRVALLAVGVMASGVVLVAETLGNVTLGFGVLNALHQSVTTITTDRPAGCTR